MLKTCLRGVGAKACWVVYLALLVLSSITVIAGGGNIFLSLAAALAALLGVLLGFSRYRLAKMGGLLLAILLASVSGLQWYRLQQRLGPITTDIQNDSGSSPLAVYPLKVVDIDPGLPASVKIAVQAGVGLFNRKQGGSVYTRMKDKDTKWMEELGLRPDEIMDAAHFLELCMSEFPRCVRYSYREQQALLPNILTVGAVLEAIPIDVEMEVQCSTVVFDATETFKALNTPYLATEYVYFNFVNETTGLAMLNPGYRRGEGKVWDPEMAEDMDPCMVDLVFSEKLFVMFLVNGCIECTKQNTLLNSIVSTNPWPKPIGVYGYANYWMVFGGYAFEAQTLCARSRNMGAIPTETNNLSFFSTRREPITDPSELKQNALEDIDYDPTKTYVAFVVGDGDNISFIMDSRAEWIRERSLNCLEKEYPCPPLTWSISPHLTRLAPDVLKWFFEKSYETGKDYFMLPPSGHLYAYPASMEEKTMQDAFVEATERDAELIGTHSTVHWEWLHKWRAAENRFLPKYAKKEGSIQGIFPVNVPYMFPTFTWKEDQFFKVLVGEDGGKVVLFRPREWRGIDDRGGSLAKKFYLSPENMAKELAEYPRGTVTGIYMTSDGGLSLTNSIMALVRILPEHVCLVSGDTAVKFALEASKSME